MLQRASNDEVGVDKSLPKVDETLLDGKRPETQIEQSAKLLKVYERVVSEANASNNTIAVAKYKKFIEWARQGMTQEEILAKENEQITQMKEDAEEEKRAIAKLSEVEEAKNEPSSLWSKMKQRFGVKG